MLFWLGLNLTASVIAASATIDVTFTVIAIIGVLPLWALTLVVSSRLRRAAARLARNASLPRPFRNLPILLLRSPADETSFGLATAQAGLWALRMLSTKFEWVNTKAFSIFAPRGKALRAKDYREIFTGLAVVSVIFILTGFSLEKLGMPTVPAVVFFGLLSILGLLWFTVIVGSLGSMLAVPFLPLVSLALMPFGGPLLAATAPFLDISVEPTPPGEWRVHQLSRSITGPGLKHSVTHSSPDALLVLGAWLNDLVVRQTTLRADRLPLPP